MKNTSTPSLVSAPARYTLTALSIHWVMALLIIGMLAVGFVMGGLPTPTKFTVYGVHKSVGLMLIMLVIIRLVYRVIHPAPKLPKGTPKWQIGVAHATHTFLYIMMIAIPLSGWLMSDAAGYHPAFFGLNVVPQLVQAGSPVGGLAHEIHEIGAFVLVALVAMHVGAALYHHVWLKDGLIRRMLP